MSLYLEHFGLDEPPFRITPHVDFFFDGADRGATLDALIYAILHDEGIVKVSGEVGSGKTMLCRVLMSRLPQHVDTIYLATPSLARDEILHAIADDLDLKLSAERPTVALRQLQEHLIGLYAAGRRVVVLVDEAHVMPEETLEQVRLLSNLESSRHKLLQIVLFGQPELDATLAKPSLRQLRDRITHAFRTRPLSQPEVARYLTFRMRAAGYRGPDVFAARAVAIIARASQGLTRRINILADKALLAAYADSAHGVTARHARAALADSQFEPAPRSRRVAAYVAAALLAGVALGTALQSLLGSAPGDPAPLAASAPAAVSPPLHEPAREPPPKAPEPAAAPQAAPAPEPPKPGPEPQAPPAASGAMPDAPAVAIAPDPRPPEPLLNAAQLARLGSYSAGGRRLLQARLAATRAILQRTPDDEFALELFVTENVEPGRMERFLVRAQDLVPLEQVFVIPMVGKPMRLWVVFGAYPTREAALEAEKRLPPLYQREFRISPRSFAELRRPL